MNQEEDIDTFQKSKLGPSQKATKRHIFYNLLKDCMLMCWFENCQGYNEIILEEV